ncbi:MAG: hypothetical protein ABIS00_13235 [Gemmatimonadales bacterium]
MLSVRAHWKDGAEAEFVSEIGTISIPKPARRRYLDVGAVGYLRRVLVIDARTPARIEVLLDPAVSRLPDLVAVRSDPLVRSGSSEWSVSGSAVRSVPVDVEPDALRVLRLIPSVSFSSVLSARPLIRGVDADDAGFTVDGHEVINLFHIGRFFSAFPALGVQETRVATQPTRVEIGRTTSGRIEIRGLEWERDKRPEIQYGLGAWSGAAGWRRDATSGVLVGRTIKGALSGVAAGTSEKVSVAVHDLYGRLDLRTGGPPVSLSFFRSEDKALDEIPDEGNPSRRPGLDWGNLLLGASSVLLARPSVSLNLRAAYSDHYEKGFAVPARTTFTDVDNLSRKVGGAIDGRLSLSASGFGLRFGAEFANHRIRNVLTPVDPARFPSSSLDRSATESGGFVELESPILGGVLRAGARVDALDKLIVLQPRVSFALSKASGFWTSLGVGRAARLVHLLSDARTEPKLAYYDVWLFANGANVPIATADHFSAEIGLRRRNSSHRIGVFYSTGLGQMSLVPEVPLQLGAPAFRTGRMKVWGAELEIRTSTSDDRWAGQVSYSFANSQRDWGSGWTPWLNDRRHQLRLNGIFHPNSRTTLSSAVEVATAQPYTPFLRYDSLPGGYAAIYGAENSARGRAGVRLDASVQRAMKGPFGTSLSLGLSVSNLAAGDQSAREGFPGFPFGGVLAAKPASKPLISLPPIPSLLVRILF